MPAGRRRSAPKASAARPPGWTVRSRRPIGKGSLGSVMRFHGVCGRLVSHPLHENRLPGDTLFKNPHRPSKAAGLETPVNFHERIENKLFLDRTRKDSNFKRPHICATLFQIEKCWYSGLSGIWFRFRINVRLVLNEQEKHLLVVYSLKDVALTEGDMRRDLIRSALIAVPLAIILTFMTLFFRTTIFGLNVGTFMSILFVTFFLVYMQIREAVFVEDLLTGRDFKARSLINLLDKEHRIRKMSAVFQTILEQAETWDQPEVIDLTPEPLLSLLENENAVAG